MPRSTLAQAALTALAAALAATGCATANLEVPYVANPVLLGPVDRIGGHRADPAAPHGEHVEVRVADFIAVSQSSRNVGNGQVEVTQTSRASSTKSGAVTEAVLAKTEGRADRDVRLAGVPVGAWAFIGGGAAVADRWAILDGHIVEVRRGR